MKSQVAGYDDVGPADDDRDDHDDDDDDDDQDGANDHESLVLGSICTGTNIRVIACFISSIKPKAAPAKTTMA